MSYSAQSTSILSFPVEILQDIAQLTISLPNLRLVCTRFNDIVTPQIFSRVLIRFWSGKQDKFLEALEALAIGEHPAVLHAKSLTIQGLIPDPEPPLNKHPIFLSDEKEVEDYKLQYKRQTLDPYYAHSQSIKEWLPRAIGRLKQVSTVTWFINNRSDEWTRDCVISGISQMPSFTKLILNTMLGSEIPIRLHSLPPVQTLAIHGIYNMISPNGPIQGIPELIARSSSRLLRIEIKSWNHGGQEKATLALSEFLHDEPPLHITHLTLEGFMVQLSSTAIPHLHSLESLYVKDYSTYRSHQLQRPTSGQEDLLSGSESVDLGDIWSVLMNAKIYLREIILDDPTESCIQYLRAYAGLKSLSFTGVTGTTEEQSEKLALEFYSDTICGHADSLEKLEVSPVYEGKWCFGEHNIQALSKLFNLRHLSMSIVADSTRIVKWPASDMNDVYNYLHGTKTIDEPQTGSYDPLHPVCLLMKTACLLPKLGLLSIRNASLVSNRNDGAPKYHAVDPIMQIETHISSFGPLDPLKYRFTVVTENSYYFGKYHKIQRLEGSEGFWYQ
ncbi:hypothetical protein BDQ17DRAFT_1376401 [Cyathus striatus]|nr:hypothetical protein BDQ17DRAFT_1376401 [Cyathus striatus]